MRTLRFMLRKEFLQIFRDRFMVAMMFFMPIVQLLILSSAATFEVKRARMYVVDRDHSSASRALVRTSGSGPAGGGGTVSADSAPAAAA